MRYSARKVHEQEVQLQMLVGNKTFPVFPIRSASEAFAQLKKALGVHGSGFHSFSIDTARKYCFDHFIVGLDTEKVFGGIIQRYQLQTGPNHYFR